MSEFVSPVVGGSDNATAYRFLDTLSYVRVRGAQTNERCSVVEMHLRAGHAPPMHVHESADETIHVVDGAVTAHTPAGVTAGDTVVLPRGEAHSLVAEDESVILTSTTPAGFAEFVAAVGEPADTESVPSTPPSEEAIARTCGGSRNRDRGPTSDRALIPSAIAARGVLLRGVEIPHVLVADRAR